MDYKRLPSVPPNEKMLTQHDAKHARRDAKKTAEVKKTESPNAKVTGHSRVQDSVRIGIRNRRRAIVVVPAQSSCYDRVMLNCLPLDTVVFLGLITSMFGEIGETLPWTSAYDQGEHHNYSLFQTAGSCCEGSMCRDRGIIIFIFLLISASALGCLFYISTKKNEICRAALHFVLCMCLAITWAMWLRCYENIKRNCPSATLGPGWGIALGTWIVSAGLCSFEMCSIGFPKMFSIISRTMGQLSNAGRPTTRSAPHRSGDATRSSSYPSGCSAMIMKTFFHKEEKSETNGSQRPIRTESSVYDGMFGQKMLAYLSAPLEGIKGMLKGQTPQDIANARSEQVSRLWNAWMAEVAARQDQVVVTELWEMMALHRILVSDYTRTLSHLRDNPGSPLKVFGCFCESMMQQAATVIRDRNSLGLDRLLSAMVGGGTRFKCNTQMSPGLQFKSDATGKQYSVVGELRRNFDGAFYVIMRGSESKLDSNIAPSKLLMAKVQKSGLGSFVVESNTLRVLKNTPHPNVIALHDFCSHGIYGGLIMEEASQNLREYHNLGTFGKHEQKNILIRDTIRGIFAGIMHLHNLSIFHLDLKPESIFMKNNVPKIGDFETSTFESEIVPLFLRKNKRIACLWEAPEITCKFKKPTKSEKIDVYSGGIFILYLGTNLREDERWKFMMGSMKRRDDNKKKDRAKLVHRGSEMKLKRAAAGEDRKGCTREDHVHQDDDFENSARCAFSSHVEKPALAKAFEMCTHLDPEQRASAKDVLDILDAEDKDDD
mmetsp:Transcript_14474/g.28507  ORF Transcript_14474/g.28507 Transcript_14474/m.28507 type:complete len:771 (+) Transcript_14474:142-2454(+)